jgi:hypothetical protein
MTTAATMPVAVTISIVNAIMIASSQRVALLDICAARSHVAILTTTCGTAS